MGRYTAIADTGNAIVKLLRREMVPDIIQNPDSIGLCNPTDKGDFVVGIHLYDVRESEEIRANTMLNQGMGQQQYPAVYLNLFYMITIYSNGDIKFRSGEEQKILGKVIQILHDYSCLDAETYEPVVIRKQEDIEIRMLDMQLEDKMRVYNVPNAGYKTSLFYKLAPVGIESSKVRSVSRVTDIDITLQEKES